jgi:hypothetical protein
MSTTPTKAEIMALVDKYAVDSEHAEIYYALARAKGSGHLDLYKELLAERRALIEQALDRAGIK